MRSQILLSVISLSALATASPTYDPLEKRLNNGLGKTPALGWNSWNTGGCSAATAQTAINQANAMISKGLKSAGYLYINIDDCWAEKSRDSSGNLVPDPSKWPNGIKAVADQIHNLGLKFGMYGDAGTMTCAGYPGSEGHEAQDAKLLASWGVDYWKYDACYLPCNNGVPQTCWVSGYNVSSYYGTMRDALAKSGRSILFSLCSWGRDSVWTWGANYGNSWRMSGDIQNSWSSIASIAASASGMSQYAAPGGFNDLDMMEIGNGVLTAAEERAHFGIWAIAKSPIILGTDLTKISGQSLTTITNKGIIAIHQDSLGKAATYFRPSGAAAPVSGQLYQYWAGQLSDGVVIGLVASQGAATLTAKFSDVPGLGSGTYNWVEYYSGKTGSGTSVSAELGSHDMAVYKVTKPSSPQTQSSGPPVTTTASAALTSTTEVVVGGAAWQWAQCGGIGWTGPTACESPYACSSGNPAYYSRCY